MNGMSAQLELQKYQHNLYSLTKLNITSNLAMNFNNLLPIKRPPARPPPIALRVGYFLFGSS